MILEKFKIPNKIAIVTGAMGGNGFAIADALGEAGANLILTDIKEDNIIFSGRTLYCMLRQSYFSPIKEHT